MKKRLRKKQKKSGGGGGVGAAAGAGAGAGAAVAPPSGGALTGASGAGSVSLAGEDLDTSGVDSRVWTLQLLREGVPAVFATAPDGGVALFDSEKDSRQYCVARGWTALALPSSLTEALAAR